MRWLGRTTYVEGLLFSCCAIFYLVHLYLGSRPSNVCNGSAIGQRDPTQPPPGRVMGIADIRGEKLAVGGLFDRVKRRFWSDKN